MKYVCDAEQAYVMQIKLLKAQRKIISVSIEVFCQCTDVDSLPTSTQGQVKIHKNSFIFRYVLIVCTT